MAFCKTRVRIPELAPLIQMQVFAMNLVDKEKVVDERDQEIL